MKTYCPHCGTAHSGRCPRTDRTREPWRSEYRTREYAEARQAAIGRSGGRCVDCGRVCAAWDGTKWRTAGLGGEVDHVTPLWAGGTSDAGNLALRCASCHRKADAARRG